MVKLGWEAVAHRNEGGRGLFAGNRRTGERDTTAHLIAETRARRLYDLSRAAAEAPTALAACEIAIRILANDPDDVPFALVYLLENHGGQATLVAACGSDRGTPATPETVDLHDSESEPPWALKEVLSSAIPRQLFLARTPFADQLAGPTVREALVLPLTTPRQGTPLGVLVVGLGPHRPFNSDYRYFLESAARHIGIAVYNAQMFERQSFGSAETRHGDARLAELATMSRLHQISTRALANAELEPLLQDVLEASIALLGADYGKVQLCDPHTGALRLVAQQGFTDEAMQYFDAVYESAATVSCRTAVQKRCRVIVENVLADACFAPFAPHIRRIRYHALQATPLISRRGELLGAISTHFGHPHHPSALDLRLSDLYARQAAELIERFQADEKLRRSEERFRRYFDLGLIGGSLTAPDKSFLEVNEQLCRILGYERHELARKTWDDMTHPDDLEAEIEQFELVLQGKQDGYSLDKRWIRKDGEIVHSIMAARAVRHPDGSIDYIVGLVQDITKRKSAEESLQRLQQELAHIARVTTMGEMASSIAHELKQPLTAIVTNAHACARWLAKKPSNMKEANAAISRIVRDATRASRTIARIRAFVQRREMQVSSFDLGALARETVSMTEADAHRHGVSLTVATSTGLRHVMGDRVLVQQVILNLLKNSVEAMETVAGRKRMITITVEAWSDSSLRLAVTDSGVGLGQTQRERALEAFHTTKPAGMGMGLAISRSIVEAHRGKLWPSDNDGPGVTFQFTLPIARETELYVPREVRRSQCQSTARPATSFDSPQQ